MWGRRVFFSPCGYVTLANMHYLHIQMCYDQSNLFQQLLNVHLHYHSSKQNLNNLYADIWPKLTKPQCCHHGDWLMQLHLPSVQSQFIMLMPTLHLCASCDRDGCVQKAASLVIGCGSLWLSWWGCNWQCCKWVVEIDRFLWLEVTNSCFS